jgi:hypothetical protein
MSFLAEQLGGSELLLLRRVDGRIVLREGLLLSVSDLGVEPSNLLYQHILLALLCEQYDPTAA